MINTLEEISKIVDNEIVPNMTNPCMSYDTVVVVNAKNGKALADLEYLMDMARINISAREDSKDKSAAQQKIEWKNETILERRYFNLCEGFRTTLKQMEYRLSK